MNAPLPSQSPIAPPPGTPEWEFGRSAEDFPVARVGDLVFAMLPARDGRHFLASAWRVQRPLSELKRDDFYSHSGPIEDEAAFRARMVEQAEHCCEVRLLSRTVTRVHCHTPCGPSQTATVHAEGVVEHSTASHGGFHLSAARNAQVDATLRTDDGWYEEDCAWAAVTITFPHLFSAYERRCAEKTLKDWRPDAWEAIFGTILGPGESCEKDRRAFEAAHAGDWIVTSAIHSRHHPGMTEVVATLGGKRTISSEERRFLVPSNEYAVGRFGFVINLDRHAPYDGPSDFIGWTGRAT